MPPNMRSLASLLLASLLSLTNAYDKTACNSSPDLCDVPYPSILHLGTHDSAFVRTTENSFSTAANQYFPVKTQLSNGIRLLQNQIHLEGSDVRLCHTSCGLFDAGPLSDYLSDVAEWLEENPSEVVTLLFANLDKLGPDRLKPLYEKSGLDQLAYIPTGGLDTWPTLGEMIGNDTRLVTFVSQAGASGTYLMPEFDYIYETSFENFAPEELGCEHDRGAKWGMGLMNHFLYTAISMEMELYSPNDTFAETLNDEVLENRLKNCTTEWGTKGGMVLLDFYNEGDAIAVVDKHNGVENPVNREPVGEDPKKTASDAAENVGLVGLVKDLEDGKEVPQGAWVWAAANWMGGWGKNGTVGRE